MHLLVQRTIMMTVMMMMMLMIVVSPLHCTFDNTLFYTIMLICTSAKLQLSVIITRNYYNYLYH